HVVVCLSFVLRRHCTHDLAPCPFTARTRAGIHTFEQATLPYGSPASVVAYVQQGPQTPGDRLARTKYARTNRTYGTVHGLGDLFVAEAFNFAQNDGSA